MCPYGICMPTSASTWMAVPAIGMVEKFNSGIALEAIIRKEAIEKTAFKEDAWLLFYHDPFLSACKFDEKGNLIVKW